MFVQYIVDAYIDPIISVRCNLIVNYVRFNSFPLNPAGYKQFVINMYYTACQIPTTKKTGYQTSLCYRKDVRLQELSKHQPNSSVGCPFFIKVYRENTELGVVDRDVLYYTFKNFYLLQILILILLIPTKRKLYSVFQ